MKGAHQPSELHPVRDVSQALVGLSRARAVIEKKEETSTDLDAEKEECHSAQQVPMAEAVARNCFLHQGREQFPDIYSLVDPFP